MIFGPTPLDRALGSILAHTRRLPGLVLKKGAVLDSAALAALRAAGHDPVIAATLEPGDVPEDEAATRLADALLAPGLDRSRAGTGRVNLLTHTPGLLRVDARAVDALNAVDESLTLATLPDWSTVAPGEMIATIKIIPFAVPGAVLARALAAIRPGAIGLHPYTPRRVGLVMSTLPGLKPSILAGTEEATRNRVESLGGQLLPAITCPHETPAIAAALHQLVEAGADILLVAGASAVVDRRDVGPAGIVAAGGAIHHFGMPVDPGNLICLGQIGARPALVLPGCARSPKLNGIDWVLQRLFANLDVDGPALAGMGVGGLLKDVGARPLPRTKAAAPRPRIATIVLAAGRSSRMAPRHKLLVPTRDGRAIVARVVDNLLSAPGRPLIVVTGHRAPRSRSRPRRPPRDVRPRPRLVRRPGRQPSRRGRCRAARLRRRGHLPRRHAPRHRPRAGTPRRRLRPRRRPPHRRPHPCRPTRQPRALEPPLLPRNNGPHRRPRRPPPARPPRRTPRDRADGRRRHPPRHRHRRTARHPPRGASTRLSRHE